MTYKWGAAPRSPVVAHYHRRVGELVEERLKASGRSWEDAVNDPALELTRADFQAVEDELLATGVRFAPSAAVSVAESPDKYRTAVVAGVEPGEPDDQGRIAVGRGANVFRAADLDGVARFVSSVETVMGMLADGVPADTVAIIDDAGGTLTAPVMAGFAAVVCKGGTVRSHLAILAREYEIPCLMAATVSGLSDGDRIRVEYSVPADTAYAGPEGDGRAHVWRLV